MGGSTYLREVTLSRRSFFKATAGVIAGAMLGSYVSRGSSGKIFEPVLAQEAEPEAKLVKTICIFCAVGCGVKARVENGALTGIEPWDEHPINGGRLCCKGASTPTSVVNDRRLKSPMIKEKGKWRKISWEEAYDIIAKKMIEIRERYGPDALFFAGSAHVSNEAAYLQRKFMAFWGSNNIDHQARICHSTTVAGLGNTWGYGAQTNNFNDMRHARCIFFLSNPAEAHPVSFRHLYAAKQRGAILITADPRYSRTAAQSDLWLPMRSGTDIPLILGMANWILQNNWHDEEFIRQRTNGFKYVKEVVEEYPPEVAAEITGVPEEKIKEAARLMAQNQPSTIQYAMGATQHEVGTNNIRSFAILQLLLGNAGKVGGGVNAFRGHDNVQGATDLAVLANTLPSYYGLSDGAWKHWAKVWGVDYQWLASRFASKEFMNKKGFTMSRWRDGVLAKLELGQPTPLKMAFLWGHSTPSQAGMAIVKKAYEDLEMLVIVDPYVENAGALAEREDGIVLLPASTTWEFPGTVTASPRQVQWRNKVIEPLYDSKPDVIILLELAEKLAEVDDQGWKEFSKNFSEIPEDIYDKEIRVGARAIGMRQSTWRLKRQQDYDYVFDQETLQAVGGPVDGEYWGLPWPCWNDEHPGTPILYRNDIPVAEGGHDFRVRWGTEAPDGTSLLSAINGHPELNPDGTPGPGWKLDLTTEYRRLIAANKVPYGRGRARFWAWNLPDPVPVHREPLWTPRPDLAAKYPAFEDKVYGVHFRVLTKSRSLQEAFINAKLHEKYPLIWTSGRQVEHHGGGSITRANQILTELQPEMYVEIHPKDAHDRGIRDGDLVWVSSPRGTEYGLEIAKTRVRARVTKGIRPGTVFMPFHWGGIFQGADYVARYPKGTAPLVVGDSANIVAPPGWDATTQMQTTKSGMCEVSKERPRG